MVRHRRLRGHNLYHSSLRKMVHKLAQEDRNTMSRYPIRSYPMQYIIKLFFFFFFHFISFHSFIFFFFFSFHSFISFHFIISAYIEISHNKLKPQQQDLSSIVAHKITFDLYLHLYPLPTYQSQHTLRNFSILSFFLFSSVLFLFV